MSGSAAVGLPEWCERFTADNPGPMTLDGTNTYLISTPAGAVVVDPGPAEDPEHVRQVAARGPVALAVLTHHHRDHSGAVEAFHELTGALVLARDPRLCVGGQALPGDGAALDLPGPQITVLDTPGHTADSVSLTVTHEGTQLLLTGDTVLGSGTTIVAHPDGRLGDYLSSLRRLQEVAGPGCLLLPAHGPVRADAAAVVADYLSHREQRLEQIKAALSAGAGSAREAAEMIYTDLDPALLPQAERMVEAALVYLRTEVS